MDPVSAFLDFCFESNCSNVAKKKAVTYNYLDSLFSLYDSWPLRDCDCTLKECLLAYCIKNDLYWDNQGEFPHG